MKRVNLSSHNHNQLMNSFLKRNRKRHQKISNTSKKQLQQMKDKMQAKCRVSRNPNLL